jgi:hypothetical protein
VEPNEREKGEKKERKKHAHTTTIQKVISLDLQNLCKEVNG